jgi:hypothetical protein
MTTKIVPLLPDDIWYENIFPIDVLTAYRARALTAISINGDARDEVQSMAKFQPPSTWPWL